MSVYTNAEHLREWDDLSGPRAGDEPSEPRHYCDDCGEPIAGPGAPCLNCAEQSPELRAFVFSRVNPTERAGELRHYTATTPGEACMMLERDLAGFGDVEDWGDALIACDDCSELMLWWQPDSHRCK